jgi:cytochrome P450
MNLATTPTPTFMPWGYCRHVCSGRCFVVQLMKQALSYLVLNYEFDSVVPPPKRQALLNIMVPPVNAKLRIGRKTS